MQLVLPAGWVSVHVPRETAGSEAAVDIEADPVLEQDMTTGDQSSPVVTIAGEADVSQQLFDQTPANPGFDGSTRTSLVRPTRRSRSSC
jgi:hypothetical protein